MDRTTSHKKVRDIGLAAALISHGFSYYGTSRDDEQVFFLFRQSEKLIHTIRLYRENTLTVRARSYHENIKMLKRLVFTEE